MSAEVIASPTAKAVLGALLEARTGQQIGHGRAWRLETALRPILRDHAIEGLDALVGRLLDGRHPHLADIVVDALLNQETSFFRDPAVFGAVAELLDGITERRPRIWAAGCSAGQEPFSLAMMIAERDRPASEIVATDVSEPVLARARLGRFSHFEIQRGLPIVRMMRWFQAAGEEWEAKPELRRMVSFRHNNLVTDPAPSGQFDVVLCRNVLFYLALPIRRRVLGRLAGALRPGGVLVLGAGETVIGQSDAFEPSKRWRGLYEPLARPWPPREAAASAHGT
jgi:chemotaxis protein methyltransferase CheR